MTIDVTFGGSFDYIGLKRLLLGQFKSLMNDLNSSTDEISEKLKASVSNDTFKTVAWPVYNSDE